MYHNSFQVFGSEWRRRYCLNQITSCQTSGGIWRKERHDNKNVKNAISPQHENRRWIFTGVCWIDSIPNWNCLASFRVGALSGLVSTGVQELIGNWLYLKKRSGVCRIETDGEELYRGPACGKGFDTVGNGLYLMKQGGLYDSRGLILGPNSPFKNIPILGMILWY